MPHTTPAVGSVFSGVGGLDIGATEALGGRVVWHCETDPSARRVLARHWPDAPNHGDVAAVNWAAVEPVDILCGGFPCPDLSEAGLHAGLVPDPSPDQLFARTANWTAMRDAIAALRPAIVVIENVEGLLSARYSRSRGQRGGAWSHVLWDLAALGFDAEWALVAAAEVGAPHVRRRVFAVAAHPDRLRRDRWAGWAPRRRDEPADSGPVPPVRPDWWGDVGPAIGRWERRLGRPADTPTLPGPNGGKQLNPRFAEWMMGFPAGWITETGGVDAAACRKLAGNAVVPQAAAYGVGLLAGRLLGERSAVAA